MSSVVSLLTSVRHPTRSTSSAFALWEKQEKLARRKPFLLQVVREASKRVLGLRPFDVQLIGGMVAPPPPPPSS